MKLSLNFKENNPVQQYHRKGSCATIPQPILLRALVKIIILVVNNMTWQYSNIFPPGT